MEMVQAAVHPRRSMGTEMEAAVRNSLSHSSTTRSSMAYAPPASMVLQMQMLALLLLASLVQSCYWNELAAVVHFAHFCFGRPNDGETYASRLPGQPACRTLFMTQIARDRTNRNACYIL